MNENSLQNVIAKPSSAPKVGSVAHALAILELLADSPGPLGVTAIARALELSPSSCFNILKTLVVGQYVMFDTTRKVYSLGFAPLRLARRALDPTSAFQLLRSQLEEVAHKFGVTIALWRAVQAERFILLGYCEHEGATRIHMTVGQQFPVYTGTLGRCVAASRNLSRDELKAVFATIRWQRAPAFDDYAASVEQARLKGWAVDVDSTFAGVTNVGAPIMAGDRQVAFGMTATMFTAQQSPEMTERLGTELLSTAARAAEIIGL